MSTTNVDRLSRGVTGSNERARPGEVLRDTLAKQSVAAPFALKHGMVTGGTAAVWDNATETKKAGTVTAREFVPIPAFDPAQTYASGDRVSLAAPSHDAGQAYDQFAIVAESGSVYQADAAVTAGAFSAGDWTLLGAVGDVFAALSSGWAPPDPFPAAWTAIANNPEWQLSTTVVTLPHFLTAAPVEGAEIGWHDEDVITQTCAAAEGYA